MDLNDTKPAIPVIAETIIVKPENQNTITRQNGNRNIKFFLPDFIRYYLPSQSNFECNITMEGRGRPIPSPSAAFHSFWRRVTTRDGTSSHTIEETDYYNSLVAQMYTLKKTDQLNNQRLNFEGLQPNNSFDNNLYWTNNSADVWASKANAAGLAATTTSIASTIETAKQVQISSSLKTDLLNSDNLVPLNTLQGANIELEIEDYRRSLEYTTSSLGVEKVNGMCPGMSFFQHTGGINVVAGQEGTNFTSDAIYSMHSATAAGPIVGWVSTGTVAAGGALASGQVQWYCNSDAGICPPDDTTGGNVFVLVPGGGGTNATIEFSAGSQPVGALRVANVSTPYFVDLACGTPLDTLGAVTSVNNNDYGSGTERDPFRVLNAISNVASGLSQTNQAPNNMMPFSVGDSLFINTVAGGAERSLGLVSGFTQSSNTGTSSGNPICRVYFQPNAPVVTGAAGAALADGDLVSSLAGGVNGTGFDQTYQATSGYVIYVKQNDRLNGITGFPHVAASPAYCPGLKEASAKKIDFNIEDLEYHVKRAEVDKSVDDNDMALANGSGFKFDLETTITSLINVTNVLGQVSQNISIPKLRRALAVLSVPLTQDSQFSIDKKSLVGDPTGAKVGSNVALQQGMTSYQYSIGTLGRQPMRPVPVEKASFKNPLIQTQSTAELIKGCDGFGFQLSNLSGIGMNFSIARQFARPGQFMDLQELGDLQLLANYEDVASSNKLFCHFIRHLRSIVITKGQIIVQN